MVTHASPREERVSAAEVPAQPTPPAPDRELSWRQDAAIQAFGLGKRFDETWVVKGLELDVDEGSIHGLFGPSGSGKTTSIRLLLGLLAADEGQIRVLGRDPRRFRSRTRARIGYMPQLFVLYPELSVWENLDLIASLYGMPWFRRNRPMRQALEFVELWDHRNKPAEQLSGGMKRRLELAAALVHQPDLLVVDEPTAGIDPILRSKLWDHFRSLRDAGTTIFLTSQYVTEAEYCDQLLILGGGTPIAAGSPEELRLRAMGGELVEVVAPDLQSAVINQLDRLEGVRSLQRDYDRTGRLTRLELVVERASAAIPEVVSLLKDHGVSDPQVQQHRPTFDDVFVKLVEHAGGQSVE